MLRPLLVKMVETESALCVYIWISTCWRIERSWVGEERICYKWCDREKPHMASLCYGKGSRLQGSCGSRGNNYLWKVGQFRRIWDRTEKKCVFLKDNKHKHQVIQAIKTYWTKLKSVKQEKEKRWCFTASLFPLTWLASKTWGFIRGLSSRRVAWCLVACVAIA